MYDVISFGSAVWDTFIKSGEFGVIDDQQVEKLTLPAGSKCRVEEIFISSGGGGTNTGVGLARLGLKTAVVARLGWDFAGKAIRKELKTEGVGDSLLVQSEQETTDQSFILIGPEGKSTVLVYRGKTRLEKKLLDFGKFKCRWFCISNLEGNLDLLGQLVAYAGKNKIKVAVNPGRLEIEQKNLLMEIVKETDLLVVNAEEAAALGNNPRLFSGGMVAVTRGSAGVSLYRDDSILEAAGFKVEMVDSAGAGDAFFSGLVAGLAKNWELEKALKLGIANGASVVTEVGTKAGLLRESNCHNWFSKPLAMKWKQNA